MAAIEGLPVDPGDFAERERQGAAQWNTLSQELTRANLEVDTLQATVNGLRRMLSDGPRRASRATRRASQRFQDELDANEHDLKLYRDEMVELRRQIEMGRAQIGLGDARYQNDAAARDQFRDALEREVQLALGGGAGRRRADVRGQARPPSSRRRDSTRTSSSASLNALEAQVAERTGELQQKIDAERANIVSYQQQLDGSTARRATSSVTWPSATSASCATSCAVSSSAPTSASPSRPGRCARRSSTACATCRRERARAGAAPRRRAARKSETTASSPGSRASDGGRRTEG